MYKLIDLTVNEDQLKETVELAKERKIIIPTFKQMKNPKLVPDKIKTELKKTGLWDINPVNLFRITWKNEPVEKGGLYNELPNYIELPQEITGAKARIFALVGKFFPIGAHKVGASFACLVPRLVTGQFNPKYHEAVWPSTGNYCRGGAYNSTLLGCKSIAILPEGMSKERFDWLKTVAGEIITTPGGESNVKEIYDETWRLRRERPSVVIFNQFGELGNHLWHYEVTGSAMEEVLKAEMGPNDKVFGVCLTSGSGGTLGSGDYIKDKFPNAKLAVGEAVQCPTLLNNGFGDHRIEGIGDKHVPWIHNVKNTDMIIGIDDNDALAFFRLLNEKAGQEYLRKRGVNEELINKLNYVGISGAANLLMCIKMAKYYELTEHDCLITVLTDSSDMYKSRLQEMNEQKGMYTEQQAAIDHERSVLGQRIDYMEELTYYSKKRIHNLKYYTWIEQQQYDVNELNAQWYDYDNYWVKLHHMTDELDRLITEFNERTGLLK
mgnify:FL=1